MKSRPGCRKFGTITSRGFRQGLLYFRNKVSDESAGGDRIVSIVGGDLVRPEIPGSERAKRASVTYGSNERGRGCASGHRTLDDGMGDSEISPEIIWPQDFSSLPGFPAATLWFLRARRL
jgi:hypothetical protein